MNQKHPIEQAIPEPDLLLNLEPEELGGQILMLIRTDAEGMSYGHAGLHPAHVTDWIGYSGGFPRRMYDGPKMNEAHLAIREALAWLEAQGLLVPTPGPNGINGFRVLSRRARTFETANDFADYRAARLLPKDLLHPSLTPVWFDFMRGRFDTAVFEAFKAIEIEIRATIRAPADEVGVRLARRAFHPQTGLLSDQNDPEGERESVMQLFAGAIGSFKNPHSHRFVNIDDPTEAARLIMFASYLLSVVKARGLALLS